MEYLCLEKIPTNLIDHLLKRVGYVFYRDVGCGIFESFGYDERISGNIWHCVMDSVK